MAKFGHSFFIGGLGTYGNKIAINLSMRDQLRNFQLTSTEENKLGAIYERFKRYQKQLSMEKIAFKLNKIENKIKKHDKELERVLRLLKQLLSKKRK